MVVQRHEEMKQDRRPHTCVDPMHLRARGAVFLVLSHAPACGIHAPAWDLHTPAWATKMSPNLIHFKAYPRGFHGGINWTSGDIKIEDFRDERQRDRCRDTLGLSRRRA